MQTEESSSTAAHRQQENMARIASFVAEDPYGALRRAQRVFREGREHKRLANQHKRQAKISMAKFDEFKRNLEVLGIEVIIEDATHAHKEGTSDHGSNRSPSTGG